METETEKAGTGGRRNPKAKAKRPMAGSEGARRTAAVLLEVMSGARGPQEASQELGISTMRYYALEERALQGMVTALEPRPRGRRTASPLDAALKAQKERDQLRRDLGRTQALLRLVRKSVKLHEPGEVGKGGKHHRKPQKRTAKLVARLKGPSQSAEASRA